MYKPVVVVNAVEKEVGENGSFVVNNERGITEHEFPVYTNINVKNNVEKKMELRLYSVLGKSIRYSNLPNISQCWFFSI